MYVEKPGYKKRNEKETANVIKGKTRCKTGQKSRQVTQRFLDDIKFDSFSCNLVLNQEKTNQ
jgi:hypothetical protein